MKRETVLKKISENRKLLEAYGIKDIRLFGSLARGESRAESDVDLLVEFDQSAHIGMFEFARLRRELSELLGCEVDLATPDALHRDMKEDILKEAIRAAYNQNRKMEETSLSPHNKKCKQNMRL